MSRILNDTDRAGLLKIYKDERMRDAPANISDKTLIENFGSDEQKKLVPTSNANEAPKGNETKIGSGEATEETKAEQGVVETVEKANIIAGVSGNEKPESNAKPEDRTAYLDAFNNYAKLNNGMAADPILTTSELIELNEAKRSSDEVLERENKLKQSNGTTIKATEVPANLKGQEMIMIRNTVTGETKLFSKFTYEKFMLGKQKEWKIEEDLPELENL